MFLQARSFFGEHGAWFLLAVPVAIAGAVYLLSRARGDRAVRRRKLRTTKTLPIRDARDSRLVKIVGTLRYAAGEEPLRAPLSNRACCHYSAVVKEHRRRSGAENLTLQGGGSELSIRGFEEVIREEKSSPTCIVDDGHDQATIELAFSEVELVVDRHYKTGLLEKTTPAIQPFLDRHHYDSFGTFFEKSLRFQEGILQQGERVAVIGYCVREVDREAAGGYREVKTRVRLVGLPAKPLLITDDPKLAR